MKKQRLQSGKNETTVGTNSADKQWPFDSLVDYK
jgi:hypothetical protein